MQKVNGNEFNMDEYSRRTLAEKARIRGATNRDTMRDKQKEMFDKYGKRKWLQPLGKIVYPTKGQLKVLAFPVKILGYITGGIGWLYMLLVVDWRVMIGKWLYTGGVDYKFEPVRSGVVKLSVFVKGETVEEMELKV